MAALALAVALAAALRGVRLRPVPDQREGPALLVLDQVREDRRRKGGIVEPDLVVFATALLGRLGPGRAELDRAGVEAVGGSAFLVALDGLQRDLGAEVEGLDLALERAVAVEGEGADGGHDVISCLSLKAAPCGLDGDRQAGGDRPAPEGSKHRGERRAAAILFREEWRAAAGENSCRTPLRAGDRARSATLGQISPAKDARDG